MQHCPLRTLLHMQSCPGLCKNRPVKMYMTVYVHVCACVRMHALNLRMCSMNIHVFYDCSEYPNGRTFPMSFMTFTELVNKWRMWSVDHYRALNQGQFCTGRTQLHMQMCPGGHNYIMQQRPGGHDCMQHRPADNIAFAIMSSGYVHVCARIWHFSKGLCRGCL